MSMFEMRELKDRERSVVLRVWSKYAGIFNYIIMGNHPLNMKDLHNLKQGCPVE